MSVRPPTVAWIGPLPPPVHGASLITRRFLDQVVASGADVRAVSVAGSGHGWRHHLSRLRAHVVALGVVSGLPRRATVYVSLSGGLGLWYQVPVVLGARLGGRRVVVHHHSYAYLAVHSVPMAIIARLLGRRDRHLVLSESMADDVRRRYRTRADVRTVSNAWFIEPSTDEVAPDEMVRVIHVSNLSAAKGSAAVVRTSALLPEARITLVGPCADAALRAEIEAAPVRWLGGLSTEDVYAELSRSDVFLFPSTYVNEAEPLVVLEALSRGVPVLATRRGALAGLLPEAWLVDSDRPEDFAARLRELCGADGWREAAGHRARELFAALRGADEPTGLVLARPPHAVLQVLPTFEPSFGGPVSAALGVTAAYPEVDLTTVGVGRPGVSWAPFTTTGFPAWTSPVGPRHTLTLAPRLLLWVALRLRRFDLVHLHFSRSLTMIWLPLLARAARVPYVLQTHGMCSPWKGPRRVVDLLFTRPALRHARAICVLGEPEAAEIREMAPTAHVVVVHNAVAPTELPRSRAGVAVRPRLLFCARLHPRKGLDVFLDLAERLGDTVDCHVVGDDEGAGVAARTRVAARDLPVTFHGGLERAEVDAWMRRCDVLVHPAPAEPFGMSMIEAFAADLPVVASASSRLAPLFAAEDAALLPRDGALDEWEAAVNSVLTDEAVRSRLRAGGRTVLEAHFSPASLRTALGAVVASAVAS